MMAAQGFEPYHVPQQSRRDKLRVLSLPHPLFDPSLLINSSPPDFLPQPDPLFTHNPDPPTPTPYKDEGLCFMNYLRGMVSSSSCSASSSSSSCSSSSTYMDPNPPFQTNPNPVGPDPFSYPTRFADQSYHGDEVVLYKPQPLSPAPTGQCLSLTLSSQNVDRSNLPIDLMAKSSLFHGTDEAVATRSAVPLGPFTGYASILKKSRFLRPAQQLLEEVCGGMGVEKMEGADCGVMEVLEGHCDGRNRGDFGGEVEDMRKTSRLIALLDEIYRRYKQYYQQLQSAIASFESVPGLGNAAPFAKLALSSLSKHFRCLKNAITGQLQFTTSHDNRAEGPFKVRSLEMRPKSCQRTVHGDEMAQHQPVWRPQRGLPERAVAVLRAWLFDHFLHPYPTDTDKLLLAKKTGLSRNQVSNWFINARVRLWKPMVEEIHMLETRQSTKPSHFVAYEDSTAAQRNSNLMSSKRNEAAAVPTRNQDPMISSYDASQCHPNFAPDFGGAANGGVSLTLGLHQNNRTGLSEPFPANAARRFGLDAE